MTADSGHGPAPSPRRVAVDVLVEVLDGGRSLDDVERVTTIFVMTGSDDTEVEQSMAAVEETENVTHEVAEAAHAH